MDVTASSWLVIALGILGANLPFLNEKLFAAVPLKKAAQAEQGWRKPLALRLLEMVILYFIVGAVAFALEARIGNGFPQTWEFYAITGCLFLVLAFPGFVTRYLRKRR
ncbi:MULTISPECIES: DUF2818 family protein [Janthinobacterium]|jgi:hypothetical protein|uniref:DUF2818 domain-containing protein n=2 Tax=Janthinobacterium TaxID=29580 RepID=A0A290WZL4_9BURK|nr:MULTISPECIES: DUF2818 family protein [Janthinobacterium]AQR70455.1 hypothetical protein BZG29_20640 [Janthinobacterium sp. LM6]ATD62310.1 DUF2818 domain-containing protein [Janthinobacterium svalbardensis]MCA1860589.1 DUF2818 family protein [Janthinobacterium lividum]MCC7682155.1 DUF2818 family protein [Janthinobacterium sp. FW305-128]NVI81664.1 DUF2818 family protein [Janthinobacterium sp. BJB401]